jgi:pimeloyl-ACP methyl ester carboxylesterase
MTRPRISEFTSTRARARFLAGYDAALDRVWPVARDILDVATGFGTARVYRSGRPTGVPVVLLPGAGGGAFMWRHHIVPLGVTRPVFAVDPVGEPGYGVQARPIADGGDASRCLRELLDGLDVERAHLVGCSYGGWVALRHALAYPGRSASVTLLDPAGLAPLTAKVVLWIVAGGLAGLAPTPVRRLAARWLNNPTLCDAEMMRMIRASMSFRRRLPVPPVLTDEELAAVTAPTLALLGERSQLYPTAEIAARIGRVMPAARIAVLPGAGHAFPMDDTAIVERIATFIDTADAPA